MDQCFLVAMMLQTFFVKTSGQSCTSYNQGQQQALQEINSIDLSDDQSNLNHYINAFIDMMNKYAKQLNLNQTKFANPHGLNNKDNYSSAIDMAKLSIYSMKIPQFYQVVNTKKWETQIKFHTKIGGMLINRNTVWENTNLLLWKTGFKGIKTGITTNAGGCLATFYEVDKQRSFIIIVLGCKDQQSRFKQTQQIKFFVLNQKEQFSYPQ